MNRLEKVLNLLSLRADTEVRRELAEYKRVFEIYNRRLSKFNEISSDFTDLEIEISNLRNKFTKIKESQILGSLSSTLYAAKNNYKKLKLDLGNADLELKRSLQRLEETYSLILKKRFEKTRYQDLKSQNSLLFRSKYVDRIESVEIEDYCSYEQF